MIKIRNFILGSIVLLIASRLLFFFLLNNMNFEFISGDAYDYFGTAKNISEGNGFISPEFNPDSRRSYLGENYYYAAEPIYPLFLALFIKLDINGVMLIIISNFILLVIIYYFSYLILKSLNFNSTVAFILPIILLLNIHIQYYSFQLLSELLRICTFLIYFYVILRFQTNFKKNLITLSILFGFTSGILILVRISFLFLPLFSLFLLLGSMRDFKKMILFFVISIISFSTTLSPWIYRNYKCFDLITVSPLLSNKLKSGQTLELPQGTNYVKEELATIWRITDKEKYWKFQDEKDLVKRTELLNEIENKPTQWIKLYLLRLFELFKPYPTGGLFAKPIFQLISLIFWVPWIFGLALFIIGKVRIFKKLQFMFSLGILSFVFIHLLQNSPHSRYMLPLIPIGYLSLLVFIDKINKIKFSIFDVSKNDM